MMRSRRGLRRRRRGLDSRGRRLCWSRCRRCGRWCRRRCGRRCGRRCRRRCGRRCGRTPSSTPNQHPRRPQLVHDAHLDLILHDFLLHERIVPQLDAARGAHVVRSPAGLHGLDDALVAERVQALHLSSRDTKRGGEVSRRKKVRLGKNELGHRGNSRSRARVRTTVTGCVNISPQIGHPTAFRSLSISTGVSFKPGFTAALMAMRRCC